MIKLTRNSPVMLVEVNILKDQINPRYLVNTSIGEYILLAIRPYVNIISLCVVFRRIVLVFDFDAYSELFYLSLGLFRWWIKRNKCTDCVRLQAWLLFHLAKPCYIRAMNDAIQISRSICASRESTNLLVWIKHVIHKRQPRAASGLFSSKSNVISRKTSGTRKF